MKKISTAAAQEIEKCLPRRHFQRGDFSSIDLTPTRVQFDAHVFGQTLFPSLIFRKSPISNSL
jgi:hypothetical protein